MHIVIVLMRGEVMRIIIDSFAVLLRKGIDIGKYSKVYIRKIEKYINEYPRKQFSGKSADEVYKELFT